MKVDGLLIYKALVQVQFGKGVVFFSFFFKIPTSAHVISVSVIYTVYITDIL